LDGARGHGRAGAGGRMIETASPWHKVPERLPLEDELAARAAWLIRLRWLAAVAVLAGGATSVLVFGPGVPWLAFMAVGVGMLGYNLAFRRILARMQGAAGTTSAAWGRFARLQFLTDWVALIVLVHLTGGVGSPLVYFFVFHAIIASILLPPRSSYLHAAGGVALVATLAILEATGVLPNRAPPGLRTLDPRDGRQVAVALFFFACAVFLSNHLAGSIARRLWARTQELLRLKVHLEETGRRTQTLYDIARTIHSTLDLDEVLRRIVESTARAMGGRACSIRLLDDERRQLRMSAAFGLSDDYLAKGDVDLSRSPVDMAALQGWAVKVPDVLESEAFQYPEEAAREGIRSVLVAPMLLRGNPIGVLRLYDTRPREFSDEDMRYLMVMAGQGATAIENARSFKRLEELEEAKSKFVFMVVHELKAPIASIRSAMSVLAGGFAGDLADAQKRLLGRVDRKMSTLQELLQDLLVLGSLKNALPAGEQVDVGLDAALGVAAERVASAAEAKGLQVDVDVPAPPPRVHAVAEDLERLVGNLVDNAVKYTPRGGRVRCVVRREGARVRLEVRDTGVGIPPDAMPHLFQEFYRAGNVRQTHEGTGLGLALVRRIVDRYRGEIRVDSELGTGSTFTVWLPAAAGDGPADAAPEARDDRGADETACTRHGP